MLAYRPISTLTANVLVLGTAVMTAQTMPIIIRSIVLYNDTAGAIVPYISIRNKQGLTQIIQKVASMAAATATTVQIPYCLNPGDSLIVGADVIWLDAFVSGELLDW